MQKVMKLVCKGFTDKGPARAANILPVKATHTTGCLKELKTMPNQWQGEESRA